MTRETNLAGRYSTKLVIHEAWSQERGVNRAVATVTIEQTRQAKDTDLWYCFFPKIKIFYLKKKEKMEK
jgi:hypothetical protein